MDLQSLYTGSKIIETIENYAVAEETNITSGTQQKKENNRDYFYSDDEFWHSVSENSVGFWGQEISLFRFVISNWVARVPGLFWSKPAEILRNHRKSDIAFQSKEYIELRPPGKSRKVLGGVGTILLPPTTDGKVLMTLTASCNASAGVPALFFPEVIEALKIRQGACIDIVNAKWQPMDIQWARQFSTTESIPRGYLVIDKIDKVRVRQGEYPVSYHPFSIMEYEQKDALLFDFVFVSADTSVGDIDIQISNFFEDYRKKEGRYGEYLINPNIVQPIFESRYTCPSELNKPSEKAKLNLLYHRVREVHFNNTSLEALINNLPKHYQSSLSIRNLAQRIGVSPAILAEDSPSSMSAQLISLCIEREKVESLIDRMVFEYPRIFIE